MKTYLRKSVHGAYRKSSAALTRGTTSLTLMSSVLANKSITRDEIALPNMPPNNTNRQETSVALSPMRQTTSVDLNVNAKQPKMNDSEV